MAQWDAERAEQWIRSQARRTEVYMPATEKMLDLADPSIGNRVLDVAVGTGEQTLLAAQRVGPTGYVLATDISNSMLDAAADVVRSAGLTSVETTKLQLGPGDFYLADDTTGRGHISRVGGTQPRTYVTVAIK